MLRVGLGPASFFVGEVVSLGQIGQGRSCCTRAVGVGDTVSVQFRPHNFHIKQGLVSVCQIVEQRPRGQFSEGHTRLDGGCAVGFVKALLVEKSLEVVVGQCRKIVGCHLQEIACLQGRFLVGVFVFHTGGLVVHQRKEASAFGVVSEANAASVGSFGKVGFL